MAADIANAAAVGPATLLAVGVLVRVLGVVTGGSALLPEISLQVRLALAVALTVAAGPLAVAAQRFEAGASVPVGGAAGLCMLLGGEAAVGLALGAALAAAASAGAWAGGLLSTAAGLTSADDADPGADAQAAGLTRLAWWMSCGVFLASGGVRQIVAGVVDSVRVLPVGAILPVGGLPRADLGHLAAELPAVGFQLALALAVPALLALVGFHLTLAIACRTVPFAPATGLIQALAAVVLLAALSLGADAWADGFPSLVQGPIERLFAAR